MGRSTVACLEMTNQPCAAGIAQSSSSAAHRQDKEQVPLNAAPPLVTYWTRRAKASIEWWDDRLPNVSNEGCTVYSKSSSELQLRSAFSTHQSWREQLAVLSCIENSSRTRMHVIVTASRQGPRCKQDVETGIETQIEVLSC